MTAMQPGGGRTRTSASASWSRSWSTRHEPTKQRELVRDQFLAKLQRKKRHLSEEHAAGFRDRVPACRPTRSSDQLRKHAARRSRRLVHRRVRTSARSSTARATEPRPPMLISEHADELARGAEHGYGNAQKPEDYLKRVP